MSRICIVSSNMIESKIIQRSLEALNSHLHSPLHFEHMRPAQISDQIESHIDLLIYNNAHHLNMNLKQKVVSWRKRGFLGSILVLSKVVDLELLNHMNSLHNFVVIEKPHSDKDVSGVVLKFLKTMQVNQQRYRRFTADQQVKLESYKTEFKRSSCVQNISLGGLRLEGDVSGLTLGDLLKVQFPLDKLNRQTIT